MSNPPAFKNKHGYWYEKDGNSLRSVHRRVACKYVKNPDPKTLTDVNHKDGDKSNNDPSNLEWVTRSYNIKHAYKNGLRKPSQTGKSGSLHPRSIAIEGYNDSTVVRFAALQEAARHGYQAPKISNCLNGTRMTHKGLRWRRVDNTKPTGG